MHVATHVADVVEDTTRTGLVCTIWTQDSLQDGMHVETHVCVKVVLTRELTMFGD